MFYSMSMVFLSMLHLSNYLALKYYMYIVQLPFTCSLFIMACPFLEDVPDEEALILRRAFRHERVGTGRTHWPLEVTFSLSDTDSQVMD